MEGAFLGSPKKATTYHPPELGYLEQELLPLAGDLLGSGSRDFLAPFWRRLIRTVWDEDFDSDRPGLHASYMAIQVEAWDQVQQSIETQANWIEQPQLLRRYAQACARLQRGRAHLAAPLAALCGPGTGVVEP